MTAPYYDGQKLPSSPEAELALVNLVAGYPEAMHTLEEAGITEEFFHDHTARYLYGLLIRLNEEGAGQHPRQFEVVQAIKKSGEGWAEVLRYYQKATAEVVTPGWLDKYLNRLIDTYRKRCIIRFSAELTQMAYSQDLPSDAATTYAYQEIERIEQVTNPLNVIDNRQLQTLMSDFYRTAVNRPQGAPYGIGDFDQITKGVHLGEMTVIKARPGSGKSALAQQACYYRAYRMKRPQLYATVGDMNAPQVYNRFMQQVLGISSAKLANGRFEDFQNFDRQGDVERHIQKLEDIPLYILDDDKLTSAALIRVIKSLLRRAEIPTLDVYLDYASQLKDRGEVYERTSAISSNILHCAHKLLSEAGEPRVSMTVIHSLSKDGTTFGASQIEYDAENVFAIKNDRALDKTLSLQEKTGPADVIIEKQRHRIGGLTVKLKWNAPFTRFENLNAPAAEQTGWQEQEERGFTQDEDYTF